MLILTVIQSQTVELNRDTTTVKTQTRNNFESSLFKLFLPGIEPEIPYQAPGALTAYTYTVFRLGRQTNQLRRKKSTLVSQVDYITRLSDLIVK